MKKIINEMKFRIYAISENESACRSVISSFIAQLNPTVDEIADIRCAVSEAVTNCIVHAYRESAGMNYIYISVRLYDNREISIEISDNGCGIEDVALARTPSYTTSDSGERCGMGFLVMESFTDSLAVKSRVGRGTRVLMRKKLTP